jgi:hypothetical protein
MPAVPTLPGITSRMIDTARLKVPTLFSLPEDRLIDATRGLGDWKPSSGTSNRFKNFGHGSHGPDTL